MDLGTLPKASPPTPHTLYWTQTQRAPCSMSPSLAAETPTPPTYTSTLLNLTITHSISTACMHGVVRGPLGPTRALSLDVRGDGGQVAGRPDDHPDRHLHVEDVVQKIRKGQRRQRVSAEIGERRIGGHINRGGTEQRTRGTADRFQNRTVGTVLSWAKPSFARCCADGAQMCTCPDIPARSIPRCL